MDMNIPKDPYMLLSFINTQLRDKFRDLDQCCEHYGIQRSELEEKLDAVDYRYDEELNQFT